MAVYEKVEVTPAQKYAMEVARVGFMASCPFFAHYFYSEMREVPTDKIKTAGVDGRSLYYNPAYMEKLKPQERVFALAHEVYHAVSRHPERARAYSRAGEVRSIPYDGDLMNRAMDFVINADLVATGVGVCNPEWLYRSDVAGTDLPEDVYKMLHSERGQGNDKSGSTFGGSGHASRWAKGDPAAAQAGGRFDEVLEPSLDPATGGDDLPNEGEFKEAIARAAGAAKAMGKMPAQFKTFVDALLAPQIDWREHVRMLLVGKLGFGHETWAKPDRRRLVLNPIVIMPSRRGFGAGDVVVVRDTSGSIRDKELSAFNGEVGGVLQSVKPKRIIVIDCDAAIQQVNEVRSLDDVGVMLHEAKGRGGTSFRPPFKWIADNGVRPDALIYLTDMYGDFPDKAPGYPVVWCATTEQDAPFGDVVRIKVEE